MRKTCIDTIEDEAVHFPRGYPSPSTHHLDVERLTSGRAGEDDALNRRFIEALRQHIAIADRLQLTTRKLVQQMPPILQGDFAVNSGGLPAPCPERRGGVISGLDTRGEHQCSPPAGAGGYGLRNARRCFAIEEDVLQFSLIIVLKAGVGGELDLA